MLNLLAELFTVMTPMGSHPREALTPGHLYRLMSAEFRTFRSSSCSCVMPLIFTTEPMPGHACNWGVQALASNCPSCQPLVDEIVARHAAVYDVKDPTFVPGHFPLFS
jgi:hypothetical protein